MISTVDRIFHRFAGTAFEQAVLGSSRHISANNLAKSLVASVSSFRFRKKTTLYIYIFRYLFRCKHSLVAAKVLCQLHTLSRYDRAGVVRQLWNLKVHLLKPGNLWISSMDHWP